METQICTKCKEPKLLNEFNKRKDTKSGYQNRCKKCNKDALKQHYKLNKEYYDTRNIERRQMLKDWIDQIKSKLSCVKCEEKRWWVLDFHHINDKEKEDSISNMIHDLVGKKRIQEEIDKCTVLCSNCHRDLHYQQKLNGSVV